MLQKVRRQHHRETKKTIDDQPVIENIAPNTNSTTNYYCIEYGYSIIFISGVISISSIAATALLSRVVPKVATTTLAIAAAGNMDMTILVEALR